MKKSIAFLFFLVIPFFATAKVLVITHNYNRPDFIEMQYKTFKKFLHDEYEYVVFNDARQETMKTQIDAMCAKYQIRCIRIPQEIHSRPYLPREPSDDLVNNASIRHANCVQYSLDVLGYDYPGIVFIIDTDVALIRSFSIEQYMQDKDIAARINRPRNKARYCSPLFCMLHMSKLPEKHAINFNCGVINGVSGDTGAWTYYYLLKHPELRVVPVRMTFSHQLFLADNHINVFVNTSTPDDYKRGFYEHFGFNDAEIEFLLKKPDTFEFYLDNFFLHYRGSSYSTGDDYKLLIFNEFINRILQEDYCE